MFVALEAQVASPDTSDTVPSENVPVAVKGTVTATPTVGFVGVSATDVNVADVTVKAAVPLTAATVAVSVLVPADTPVAIPVAATLATAVFDDVQVAVAVTSSVVASLKVTTAWNGAVPWMPIVAIAGVTLSAVTVAVGTVILALPVCPASVAEMVATPGATLVTVPAETVASAGLSLAHVAVRVTSPVEPSEYLAVAWSAALVPTATVANAGVTSTPTTVRLVSGAPAAPPSPDEPEVPAEPAVEPADPPLFASPASPIALAPLEPATLLAPLEPI